MINDVKRKCVFCCRFSLFVRRWVHMWRLFCYCSYLISPTFGNSVRLCFEIVAFSEYLLLYESQHQKTYLWISAPSEDSDQTAHSRSLIRIFTGRILDSHGCKVSSWWQKTLLILRGCAGWFESSLPAHVRRYIFTCWAQTVSSEPLPSIDTFYSRPGFCKRTANVRWLDCANAQADQCIRCSLRPQRSIFAWHDLYIDST